jgi:putative Mg2+ transporter-C (MgtC) family protein
VRQNGPDAATICQLRELLLMFSNFDWSVFVDDLTRLGAAALLGGAIGLERELEGHFAGLRTHMMVAIGCAVFVIAGLAIAGDQQEVVTRVIQGVAAGIGFLGAGTILKLDEQQKIKGLTTASSIWLAAALGTVAGLAEYGLAAAAACVALFVLAVLRPLEKALTRRLGQPGQKHRMDTPVRPDKK